MDWQQIASLAIVGLTAFLLIRKVMRDRKSAGCGGNCRCTPGDDPAVMENNSRNLY